MTLIDSMILDCWMYTFDLPNALAEAWKAKAKQKSSCTLDLDIHPADNLAVEAKTKPNYIT